jgi:hypothetical protein
VASSGSYTAISGHDHECSSRYAASGTDVINGAAPKPVFAALKGGAS